MLCLPLESVKYFIKRGSKTHCVSLDASKTFDKVLYNGLFVKMLGFIKVVCYHPICIHCMLMN